MSADRSIHQELPAVTIVVTSCNRFDLLNRTMKSLLRYFDAPIAEIIIAEDSGNDAIYQSLDFDAPRLTIILNKPQLGQMKSIDRAYELVKTDYVFHCEDDWEFLRPGFIAESLAILQAFPLVSMVGLRARTELNPLIRNQPVETLDGLEFFHYDPTLHPEYFSYSFNPGLRRISDFRKFAPMHQLGREEDVSYRFKQDGYWMANLEHPAVRHIGDERHIQDPFQHARPKSVFGRLLRSVRKRVKRLRRKFGAA